MLIKPKPLLHLTTKFQILFFTYRYLAKAHKVGCCIVFFILAAINQLKEQADSTHLDRFSMVASFVELLHCLQILSCHPKIVAFPAQATTLNKSYCSQFNTNSFTLSIDTFCSCTMMGNKKHFKILRENPLSKDIGEIGGSKLSIHGIGTFLFWIQDNAGKPAQMCIPNSLYVPDLLLPLVSPQHWGQAIRDWWQTYMINNDDECKLCWGDGKHCKMIQ